MMRNMSRGIPRLWKDGYKSMSGLEEAILKNCEAATALAQVTRTSFGPNGLSKIVINRIEKVLVTTDAATIINELEVQHPAAKVLCLAAAMQQREIGDGANFTVVFAGELLKHALELLRTGLHVSDLVRGYTMAEKKVQALIKGLALCELKKEDLADSQKLITGIKAAIGSKQYELRDTLSQLVAKACASSMPKNPKGFLVDNIRTVKILGDSVKSSFVVPGIVIETAVESQCKRQKNAKVVVFTCSVDATQTETKGTVLLHNADELLSYNKSEEDHIHSIIKGLYDMGVRVIVGGERFGEMALHFMDKYKMFAVRLTSKWTLRRLCRSIGARPCVQLSGVREADLGRVRDIHTKEIGPRSVVIVSQAYDGDEFGVGKMADDEEKVDSLTFKSVKSQVSTIVIRGATNTVLTDVERAINDGVNMVRAMARNGKFVAGAGAVEIELASQLKKYGNSVEGLEQYAIAKYAEALEVVPRTLAENAGLNETEVISALYKEHASGRPDASRVGVDIESVSGRSKSKEIQSHVRDVTGDGVIDLMATRQMGIKLGTNAAVTILRVDHIIMKKPAGGPRMGQKRGHWDANDTEW